MRTARERALQAIAVGASLFGDEQISERFIAFLATEDTKTGRATKRQIDAVAAVFAEDRAACAEEAIATRAGRAN